MTDTIITLPRPATERLHAIAAMHAAAGIVAGCTVITPTDVKIYAHDAGHDAVRSLAIEHDQPIRHENGHVWVSIPLAVPGLSGDASLVVFA